MNLPASRFVPGPGRSRPQSYPLRSASLSPRVTYLPAFQTALLPLLLHALPSRLEFHPQSYPRRSASLFQRGINLRTSQTGHPRLQLELRSPPRRFLLPWSWSRPRSSRASTRLSCLRVWSRGTPQSPTRMGSLSSRGRSAVSATESTPSAPASERSSCSSHSKTRSRASKERTRGCGAWFRISSPPPRPPESSRAALPKSCPSFRLRYPMPRNRSEN
mmetsp:Transcript_47602/g.107980  ORF Transcript_47602/g.107980 Transcript_47602/m.107980 type:complete len:218 (-) Transcript_47602:722-1375(-)